MKSKIRLPIVTRLSIRNYSLYPGLDNRGLDLEFPSGITVLAGINGVGKTTLLNLLMRMLLGPLERPKADRDLSRISKRELVLDKRFSFFADRVPKKLDDSTTATLDFIVGDRVITVTRSLGTMALKSVKLNGRSRSVTTELQFSEEMARLCGLASAYEYHVVVRYLQFFTEERQPILWSAAIQYEFFKILFLDRTLTEETNTTFASIQRLDSIYRNRVHQLNAREDRFKKSQTAALAVHNIDDLLIRIEAAKVVRDTAAEDHLKHQEFVASLQSQARDLDIELNQAEATLADLEDELENADAAFIAQALPTIDDKAKFLMAGLSSGQGCFVCGNRNRSQRHTIAKQLKEGNCFVCHHPITSRGKSADVKPLAAAQVRTLEQKVEEVRAVAAKIDTKRDAVSKQIAPALQALRQSSSRNLAAEMALGMLQAQLPDPPEAFRALEAELNAERAELDLMDSQRKALTEQYRELIKRGREQVEIFKETLRTNLTVYAEAFLQETVTVQFDARDKMKIATGAGQVGIPSFSILMTSSTHEVPKERLTSDNVSESQKEFLDLAFRMALLDMVCADGATTLVIETPEASLDSWFMLRAAALMRQFAPADSGPVRNLIATSNLNGTAMIPALLGRIGKDGKPRRGGKTTGAQLIDLLQVTAKSNTLKEGAARALLEEELEKFHG
ncbi:AAA family ATPase [Ralstonia solanacearum]|uniref:AAA family ATPase n=1 Tax=Ralstonia solanacearum TaxID=305 RepID=UPI002029E13B|nr:AAA family ATPase [Ralstonia solanacearum]MCL9847294.1 AAA family ATPase [Ralstonia solanacearum]MDC6261186.1 AAA family ATPase [Ralstonia solanacearum]